MSDKIVLENVRKSFGTNDVHKGLSISIPKGKITYIIGPSGTGKSVLLKMIIGLLKPCSGKIYVDGLDISTLENQDLVDYRYKYGYLFQNAALFDSLTIFDNVAFPLREHTKLSKSEIHEKVESVLASVGLRGKSDKLPSELSGGMRKRAGLARAIVIEPEVILYDEPTTGLDPILTDIIDNLIADTHERLKNVTTVVVSHDLASILKIPDNIIMIYDGKKIIEGDCEYIKHSDNPYIQQFLAASEDGPISLT